VILYVNGDSHAAGAEAVNSYAFAEDDPLYWGLGRQPHPDNERVSFGCELSNLMGAIMINDAESASSNHRIIRTTWKYLQGVQGLPVERPDYAVFGWSTWERKEFADPATGISWQVNAGGIGDDWPQWLKDLYPKWVSEIDWNECMKSEHEKIWQFHEDLAEKNVKHLFFNTYSWFDPAVTGTHDWNGCYIGPYDQQATYYNWLINQGFKTVNPTSYHFGPDAHYAWAEFLYQHFVQKALTS
jgi:hypothetical protein